MQVLAGAGACAGTLQVLVLMALCVRNCGAALESGVRAHGGRLANNEVVGDHGLMLPRLCRWFGRQVSVGCARQSKAKQQPGGCVNAAADGIVRAELWRSRGVRRACARRSPREQHCGWIAAFISAARSSFVWQAGDGGQAGAPVLLGEDDGPSACTVALTPHCAP